MQNSKNNKLTLTSILVLFISGLLFWQGIKATPISVQSIPKTPSSNNEPAKQNILGEKSENASSSANIAKVLKVVDGDTIEVEYLGEKKKLRYIGIDTPETVDPNRPVGCYGREASKENKRIVEGKEVILEKDVSNTDRFGRLLRLVYLKLDDGNLLFINDYLVRQGFAQVSTYPPDVKFSEQFIAAQKEARDNKRGLWGKCN